jgi:hypothetical protein
MDPIPGFVPHPPGSYVRCIAPNGLPLKTTCRDHIFRLVSEPQSVSYGCGFVQQARCLVCSDTVTPPLDADWWAILATSEDVINCAEGVTTEMIRLNEVHKQLHKIARSEDAVPTLRNFD